jgi:hypothetical protein
LNIRRSRKDHAMNIYELTAAFFLFRESFLIYN